MFISHYHEPLQKYVELQTNHQNYLAMAEFLLNFVEYSFSVQTLRELEIVAVNENVTMKFLTSLSPIQLYTLYDSLLDRR